MFFTPDGALSNGNFTNFRFLNTFGVTTRRDTAQVEPAGFIKQFFFSKFSAN
jgi:hypothetical protein